MSLQNPYISRKQAEKFTRDIKDCFNHPQDNPLLFSIYGIGGTGKSTLKDKLVETFPPQFQCAEISFDTNSAIDTPIDLMKAFDDQTSGDVSGWDIDTFAELLKKYNETVQALASKTIENDSSTSHKNRAEILSKIGTFAKATLKFGGMFTPGGAATAAVDAASSLSQAGIEKGIDSLVESAGASLDIANLLKNHSATKNNLELRELINDPLSKLAKAFIETIIQKSHHKPVLLFVDTYEKASGEFDAFLCRFLLSSSKLQQANVRFVMFGRYSLSNSRYQRMFQQSNIRKSEKQLDTFNQAETKDYLKEIGITENKEVQKLSKATKGYPYRVNARKFRSQKS